MYPTPSRSSRSVARRLRFDDVLSHETESDGDIFGSKLTRKRNERETQIVFDDDEERESPLQFFGSGHHHHHHHETSVAPSLPSSYLRLNRLNIHARLLPDVRLCLDELKMEAAASTSSTSTSMSPFRHSGDLVIDRKVYRVSYRFCVTFPKPKMPNDAMSPPKHSSFTDSPVRTELFTLDDFLGFVERGGIVGLRSPVSGMSQESSVAVNVTLERNLRRVAMETQSCELIRSGFVLWRIEEKPVRVPLCARSVSGGLGADSTKKSSWLGGLLDSWRKRAASPKKKSVSEESEEPSFPPVRPTATSSQRPKRRTQFVLQKMAKRNSDPAPVIQEFEWHAERMMQKCLKGLMLGETCRKTLLLKEILEVDFDILRMTPAVSVDIIPVNDDTKRQFAGPRLRDSIESTPEMKVFVVKKLVRGTRSSLKRFCRQISDRIDTALEQFRENPRSRLMRWSLFQKLLTLSVDSIEAREAIVDALDEFEFPIMRIDVGRENLMVMTQGLQEHHDDDLKIPDSV